MGKECTKAVAYLRTSSAANVLTIGGTALVPAAYPATARLVEELGWNVRRLDISELMKAEAGLTCSSILFEANER